MTLSADTLRTVSVFRDIPEAVLEQLSTRLRRRRYPAGAALFEQGDPGTGLLVLADGEVRISVVSPTGEEIILNYLRPGEAFGELALLDGLPRSATATALEDSEVLSLHRDDFAEVLYSEPEVMQAILVALASMIRRMNEKLVDVAMLDVSGRMAKAFLELAGRHGHAEGNCTRLDRTVSNDELASMTGLYRTEVARHLSKLEPDVLRVEDGKYVICDLDKWRRWARMA